MHLFCSDRGYYPHFVDINRISWISTLRGYIRISWILSASRGSPRYMAIVRISWISISAFHGYRGYIRMSWIFFVLVTLGACVVRNYGPRALIAKKKREQPDGQRHGHISSTGHHSGPPDPSLGGNYPCK